MRVLLVNTSDRTGGAAVAAHRLMEALNNNGVKAKMLVQKKDGNDITVVGLNKPWLQRWRFLWERWCIFVRLRFSRKNLFSIDIANAGADITQLREFREADVIHLHWINQGFLSLKSIEKILASGKPVVWTMHDAWPATGICHYPRECTKFKTGCHHCLLLPNGGSSHDLSAKRWKRKQRMLEKREISYVTCSKWLGAQAKASGLLKAQKVITIPNPIDVRIFHKDNREDACKALGLPTDKQVILFVSQRVTDQRKGMTYLIKAVDKLVEKHPEIKKNTCIAVLGGQTEKVAKEFALPIYPLGYISNEKKIVQAYNAATLFVLPSLEDNLPNTIMEAMACGVPCVGFRVGGIPEMIDHRHNGYVANYKNADDLANGIYWILHEADIQKLADNAVCKVIKDYSQQSITAKYMEVYQQAMTFKHYRL